ncbi:MAG: DUF1643 domain-containing protein [Bacillota bacterium]|nr:DUF1643 domain-containing protein [Bacillota bacterium]
MKHIPKQSIHDLELMGFESALLTEGEDYDREKWLYVPSSYQEYRYVLGTLGKNPVICVGLNPSTARPGALDNTLKSVERVANFNGHDSFLMMNLYAQRATRPKDMDQEHCSFLHRENLKAFSYLLDRTKTVWAAWGAVMETRDYLRDCLLDFAKLAQNKGAKWVTAGQRSKKGHPHHPLYLRKDSVFEDFDIEKYLESFMEKK